MAMQFGRDSRTGQLGYWDGTKFIPLQPGETGQPQGGDINIADLARQPNAGMNFENISQADQRAVQDAMKRGQAAPTPKLPSAPIPSARAAELQQGEAIASEARRDPQYLAETQQAGKESLPELLKFAASNVAPAVLSGGTNVAASGLIRGGRLLARLERMAVAGSGGYAGEKINQAVGLTPEDDANAAISGGISALPGFFRPAAKELTSSQKTIRRLAGGGEVKSEADLARGTADALYTAARAGGDINSATLLKPLDDLITSTRTTPNISGTREGEAFISKLEGLRKTLVDRMLELKVNVTPGRPGIPGTPPAGVTDVPAVSGKALSETLTTPFEWLFKKAKPPEGIPGTPGTPSKVRVESLKVKEVPKPVSTENLVDDLKQLTHQKGLYREAENLGIPGLPQKLKETYRQMAAEVPGLTEGDVIYGQAKGLQRGTKAVQSGGSVGVANLLNDPKLSGGLTAQQKAFLMKQAASSDNINRSTQALLRSPTGRAMLRAGVDTRGVVKPALWSAAMQMGARMAGLGQE